MPAGRRGHKIREYKRRIDSVLRDQPGSWQPPPPPISEEHAALRRSIAEACANIEVDPEALDFRGRPLCTPESSRFAVRALELMLEEQDLLVLHGVDWRLYQPE